MIWYLNVVDGRGLGESELSRVVLAGHVNVEDGHRFFGFVFVMRECEKVKETRGAASKMCLGERRGDVKEEENALKCC